MSDAQHDSKSVITWRAVVLIALAVIGALLMKVLDRIEKTADLAVTLQSLVSTMNSRLDAQADRINTHDRRFERIEDRIFPPRPNP